MRFQSTILEADGSQVTKELEAVDEQSLHDRLHREGKTLLRVRLVEGAKAPSGDAPSVKVNSRRLLLLTQAMQESLDAGVPLLAAFDALAEQEEDPKLEGMLQDLGQRVSSGQELSEALKAHPRAFPSVYCSLVKAGEQSGSLPSVLESIASYLEWKIEIAGVVKQAMIYPAVVISAGYGMVLFMLSFVIPRLGSVLEKIGGDLPAASQMLISASDFVAQYVWWIVFASIGSVISVIVMTKTSWIKDIFVSILASLPIVRNVVSTLAVAQFARTFSVLLRAGLTMTHALELGAAAVGSPRFRRGLLAARNRIVSGARLGEAFHEEDLLPPVALSMVKVGEEAGRLPVTFERLSRFYDREVKAAVRKALGMLEPIVTVLLGLVVGGVAVLVVITIYSAMKGVGK